MPNRLFFFILAASVSTAALSQDSKDTNLPRPAIFDDLINCRTIADDTERLACYDGNVGKLDEAQKKEEIIVTDKQSVQEAKRGLFGFNLPKLSIFGKEGEEQLEELVTTIKSARQDRSGKWTFILEDGAKWQQIDTDGSSRQVKPGMEVRIRKASLGSYFVNVEGRRAIRMMRVN